MDFYHVEGEYKKPLSFAEKETANTHRPRYPSHLFAHKNPAKDLLNVN